MSSKIVTANYISTPSSNALCESALEAVRAASPENPIIVDFDETLFLRNSTEEYLDSAYPKPVGALLLMGVKALKPWRLLPKALRGDKTAKDWCLVVAVTLLMPWTLLVWRARAGAIAKAYWNQPLIKALKDNPKAQVVVATLGFDVVVNPLLKHLSVVLDRDVTQTAISCRFWQGPADRAQGKCAMVTEALGAKAVAKAVAVTDAAHDAPLLAKVATPCLVVWPQAEFVPAMSGVYLPLFYSEKVKNPNQSHFLKRLILGHWSFLVIALSALSPHPLWNAASLLLLVISYWCVYEIGYYENDAIGEKYEKTPILSTTYARYKSQMNLNTPAPWVWSMAIALPAILLLEMSKLSAPWQLAFTTVMDTGPLMFDMAVWLVFLLSVRLSFGLYNRFNEDTRLWIYPFLQIQKLFGFTLLLGTNAIGAGLMLSLIISRWLHYSIYRCGGDRWRFPLNLSCLMLFLMLTSMAAISAEVPTDVLTLQSAIALCYCLIRSAKSYRIASQTIGLVSDMAEAGKPEPTTAEYASIKTETPFTTATQKATQKTNSPTMTIPFGPAS